MNPRRLLVLITVLSVSLAACKKRGEAPAEGPAPVVPASKPAAKPAPKSEGAKAAPMAVSEPLDLAKINTKIREHVEAFGKPPATLQELVDKKFLPSLPQAPPGRTLHYDAYKMRVELQ